MSYFSQSRGGRDARAAKDIETRPEPAPGLASPDLVSSFGRGMVVTGKVICPGTLQIFGCVTGEIHAGHLIVCEGARVEGTIVAQEAVIQGAFKGTVYGNNVRLQNTAVVDGEVFNRSLSIEQDAQFEGVSRRLDRPVDPPSNDEPPAEPAIAAPGVQADSIFEPVG